MLIDCAGNEMPELTVWMAEATKLAGDRWDEFHECYSFEAAYEDGMAPTEAVKDCRDWLDA